MNPNPFDMGPMLRLGLDMTAAMGPLAWFVVGFAAAAAGILLAHDFRLELEATVHRKVTALVRAAKGCGRRTKRATVAPEAPAVAPETADHAPPLAA